MHSTPENPFLPFPWAFTWVHIMYIKSSSSILSVKSYAVTSVVTFCPQLPLYWSILKRFMQNYWYLRVWNVKIYPESISSGILIWLPTPIAFLSCRNFIQVHFTSEIKKIWGNNITSACESLILDGWNVVLTTWSIFFSLCLLMSAYLASAPKYVLWNLLELK